MKVLAAEIGTASSIPGWPENNLSGLFDALKRWPLDRRLDYSKEPEFFDGAGVAPFRGPAWGHCVFQFDERLGKRVAKATQPIHSKHPEAVRYAGNFVGHSFGFWLDTADPELIAALDHAIGENMAMHF